MARYYFPRQQWTRKHGAVAAKSIDRHWKRKRTKCFGRGKTVRKRYLKGYTL